MNQCTLHYSLIIWYAIRPQPVDSEHIQKLLHFNTLPFCSVLIHSFIRSDLFESTHIIVQFYCSKHTHTLSLILFAVRFSGTFALELYQNKCQNHVFDAHFNVRAHSLPIDLFCSVFFLICVIHRAKI